MVLSFLAWDRAGFKRRQGTADWEGPGLYEHRCDLAKQLFPIAILYPLDNQNAHHMPRTYVGKKERLRWNDVGSASHGTYSPKGKRGPKLIFTYGQETERSHRSECGCPENMEVELGQARRIDHRRGQEGTSTEHTPLHRLHVRKQRVGPRPG